MGWTRAPIITYKLIKNTVQTLDCKSVHHHPYPPPYPPSLRLHHHQSTTPRNPGARIIRWARLEGSCLPLTLPSRDVSASMRSGYRENSSGVERRRRAGPTKHRVCGSMEQLISYCCRLVFSPTNQWPSAFAS